MASLHMTVSARVSVCVRDKGGERMRAYALYPQPAKKAQEERNDKRLGCPSHFCVNSFVRERYVCGDLLCSCGTQYLSRGCHVSAELIDIGDWRGALIYHHVNGGDGL
jgi:hypothetical protein